MIEIAAAIAGAVIALMAAFLTQRSAVRGEQQQYIRQLREQAYLAFVKENFRLAHCITSGDPSAAREDFGDSLQLLLPSIMLFGSKRSATLASEAVSDVYDRNVKAGGGQAFRELVRRELGVHDV